MTYSVVILVNDPNCEGNCPWNSFCEMCLCFQNDKRQINNRNKLDKTWFCPPHKASSAASLPIEHESVPLNRFASIFSTSFVNHHRCIKEQQQQKPTLRYVNLVSWNSSSGNIDVVRLLLCSKVSKDRFDNRPISVAIEAKLLKRKPLCAHIRATHKQARVKKKPLTMRWGRSTEKVRLATDPRMRHQSHKASATVQVCLALMATSLPW